jgi:hypothetical protein
MYWLSLRVFVYSGALNWTVQLFCCSVAVWYLHPHISRIKDFWTHFLLYLETVDQILLRKCHVTFKSGIFTVKVYFLTCWARTVPPTPNPHSITTAIFCRSVTTDAVCVCGCVWVCVCHHVTRWQEESLVSTLRIPSFCLLKGGSSEDPFISALTRGKQTACPEYWAAF